VPDLSPSVVLVPGVTLSRVVAGMWRVTQWGMNRTELAKFIEQCVEIGVTSFDLADIYGGGQAEALFGEALAACPHLATSVQIVTKAGIRPASGVAPGGHVKHYDSSEAHLRRSVEQALRALRRDRLDVFLLHRPDPLLDRDELAETVERLLAEGKIGAFGVSNFGARAFDWLHERLPLATNQISLSPFDLGPLESDTLTALAQSHVIPMIWSPLGGGCLFEPADPVSVRVRAAMELIRRERGLSDWLPIAYAWVFRLPTRPIVLTGTRRIDGIFDAVQGSAIELRRDEWFRIFEAALGRPLD
jgi:predicted oxidoreductase